MARLTGAQRLAVYGPLVTYQTADGPRKGAPASALRTVTSPWGLRVRVHHLIADYWLDTAHHAAAEVPEFVPHRMDSFNPRLIRGSTTEISPHAYGLAVDTFVTPYPNAPPGGVWTPPELDTDEYHAWQQVWARWGFRLGSTFTRRDTPHIEWAQGPPGPQHRPVTPPLEPVPAPSPAQPEDDMARFPIDLEAGPPGVGGLVPLWRLTGPDGGIQALNGAPFHGSLPSIGEHRTDATGLVRREDRDGYTITCEQIFLADGQWKTPTYNFPV